MMTEPFDILSTYIAFIQNNQGKRRPVLILYPIHHGQILRIMVITSKYNKKSAKFRNQRYPIRAWKTCGLTRPSYVDITQHGSILASAFHSKRIGHLDSKDIRGLLIFIKHYYQRH